MDKWQAQQAFWSGYRIPAYDVASVPEDAELPYITYQAAIDSLDNTIALTGDIYYFSNSSWAEISQKAEEISQDLENGKTIKTAKGFLKITQGSPFAQRVMENFDYLKHITIYVNAEYFSK